MSRRRSAGNLMRAAELFAIDEWASDSGFVERAWRSHSEPEPFFISVASNHWQLVVTTQHDVARLTIRGPETKATVTAIPADAEFFGITFSLGTFVPAFPPAGLVDCAVTLPAATSTSFVLDGARWEIPTPENADVFVDHLVRQGVVVRDPVVAESLQTDVDGVSTRTLQRRVARATGLSRRMMRQIRRAERAVDALGRGASPSEAAAQLGYADQAHLNRSLQRFIGQTPGQVVAFVQDSDPGAS
jgi:helix-turn-helix protein